MVLIQVVSDEGSGAFLTQHPNELDYDITGLSKIDRPSYCHSTLWYVLMERVAVGGKGAWFPPPAKVQRKKPEKILDKKQKYG